MLSRLALFPIVLAAASPAVASQGPIAAPPDPLGDLARQAEASSRLTVHCNRETAGADAVVCGRRSQGEQGYRVPYEPVPGEVHHVAGELPSAREAMGADSCMRLCEQPLSIDLIGAARTIALGIGRLFHPD